MSEIEKREQIRWEFEDELDNITCEADMQEWWIRFLEYNKWEVQHEVSPENSNDRADIIIQKRNTPPIGIELKYNATGRDVGKALHQITDKYRNQYYHSFGHVTLWAVSILNDSMNPKVRRPVNNGNPLIRELLCVFGIGVAGMSLHPSIDFRFSDKRCKVGLGDAEIPEYTKIDYTNFEIIEDKVANSIRGSRSQTKWKPKTTSISKVTGYEDAEWL